MGGWGSGGRKRVYVRDVLQFTIFQHLSIILTNCPTIKFSLVVLRYLLNIPPIMTPLEGSPYHYRLVGHFGLVPTVFIASVIGLVIIEKVLVEVFVVVLVVRHEQTVLICMSNQIPRFNAMA